MLSRDSDQTIRGITREDWISSAFGESRKDTLDGSGHKVRDGDADREELLELLGLGRGDGDEEEDAVAVNVAGFPGGQDSDPLAAKGHELSASTPPMSRQDSSLGVEPSKSKVGKQAAPTISPPSEPSAHLGSPNLSIARSDDCNPTARPRSRRRPLSICSIAISSCSGGAEEEDYSRYATSSATSRAVTTPTSLEFSMDDLLERSDGREGEESGQWMVGSGMEAEISLSTTLPVSKTLRPAIPSSYPMPSSSSSSISPSPINPSLPSSLESSGSEDDSDDEDEDALFTFPPSPLKRASFSPRKPVRSSPSLSIRIVREEDGSVDDVPSPPPCGQGHGQGQGSREDGPPSTAESSIYSAGSPTTFELLIGKFPLPLATRQWEHGSADSLVHTMSDGGEEVRYESDWRGLIEGSVREWGRDQERGSLGRASRQREGGTSPLNTTEGPPRLPSAYFLTSTRLDLPQRVHYRPQPSSSSSSRSRPYQVDTGPGQQARRSRRGYSISSSTPVSSIPPPRLPSRRSQSLPVLPSHHRSYSRSLLPSLPRMSTMSTIHPHDLPIGSADYSSLPLSTTPIPTPGRQPFSYPMSEPLPRVSEEAPGQVDQDSPTRRPVYSNSVRGGESGEEDREEEIRPPTPAVSQLYNNPAHQYRSPQHGTPHSSIGNGRTGDRDSDSSSYTQTSSGLGSTLAGLHLYGHGGAQSMPESVSSRRSSPNTMIGTKFGVGGGMQGSALENKSTFGPRDGGEEYDSGPGLAPPAIIHSRQISPSRFLATIPLPSGSPPLSEHGSPYATTRALRLSPRSPDSVSSSSSLPPTPVRPPRLDMRIPSARFSGSEVAAAGNKAAEDMLTDPSGQARWGSPAQKLEQRILGDLREEEGDRSGTPSSLHEQPFNINNFAFPAVPNSESDSTDIVSPASAGQKSLTSSHQNGSSSESKGTDSKAIPLSHDIPRVVSSSGSSSGAADIEEGPGQSDWMRARQATTGSTATSGTTRSGSSYGAQPLPPLTSDFVSNGPSFATYHKYAIQGRPWTTNGTSGPPPTRSLQKLGHPSDTRSFSTNTSAGSSHTPSYHPFSAASSSFPGRRQGTATIGSFQQPDNHRYGSPMYGNLGKRPSADQLSTGGAMVDVMPSCYLCNDDNPLSVVIAPEREQNTNPRSAALVRSQDQDAEDTCPICVESLNASYRLPGEKAHIVPQCGHALHEACFTEVYGAVPKGPRASKVNLGVCGICRGDMRLEHEDDGFGALRSRGNSKFAAMTGMDDKRGTIGGKGHQPLAPAGIPSSDSTTSFQSSLQSPVEASGDDPLEIPGSNPRSAYSLASNGPPQVVVPSITIISEFASISRADGKQVLTCLVTVEVPPAGSRATYPAPVLPAPTTSSPTLSRRQASPKSPASVGGGSVALWDRKPSNQATLPDFLMPTSAPVADPFAHIALDLRNRLVDYKTSAIDSLGKIRLYDILRVRKGSFILDISVYLFQQALICVAEERKKGLKSLLSSGGVGSSRDHKEKGVLKLKGRIYLRHVKRIIDSTVGGELSLTISMEDQSLDSFILTFCDRSSHDLWHKTLNRALQDAKGVTPQHPMSPPATPGSGTAGSKLTRMGVPEGVIEETRRSPQPNQSGTPDSTKSMGMDIPLSASGSMPSLLRSSFGAVPLAPVHTPVDLIIVFSIPSAHGPASASAPLKLRLIKASLTFLCQTLGPRDRLSIVTFQPGMGRIVRKTALLCPGRFSGREKLENFIVGIVNDETSSDDEGDVKDEFRSETRKEEKVDMVSGLNVGLDIVMQRKSKNPVTGMILVNDSADSIKRSSMDLVLARAEAAGVPVHSMGYGKNQDPSGLWLISSHTHGTYTFVKEWYHLRDSLAGVIGGLTSIALTNMKVHLGAGDSQFKCRKVSGAPHAVLSTDGKDVDIELKELRFGQRLEVLVEMELEREGSNEMSDIGHGDNESYSRRPSVIGSDAGSSAAAGHARSHEGPGGGDREKDPRHIRKSSSFTTGYGGGSGGYQADPESTSSRPDGQDNSLVQMSDDSLIDEVPVFDLDCSYFDPSAGRAIARLSHPLLLTIAMLPIRHGKGHLGITQADQAVSRRKFELMASESMTRALLLVSRQNWSQAQRILQETAKILMAVINRSIGILGDAAASYHRDGGIIGGGGGAGGSSSSTTVSKAAAKRQSQARATAMSLQAVLGDLDFLQEGMEERRDTFDRDHRHFGAQQALVLRTQKSWTARTPTEKLYCSEGPRQLLQISREWTSR